MEPTLHSEFADAAESYAHTGRATLDREQFDERRQRQCPTIFALPSLAAQPFWPSTTPGFVVDADVVRVISKEYHDHHDKLRRERVEAGVNRGASDVNYLMEEGRWCHSPRSRLVSEYFPVTASVLSSFPVFETRLGYVYFSSFVANTEIRQHCGPTNCKLRVQIVLYPNVDWPEDDVEGGSHDDDVVVGGGDMGVLEVAGEQRGYRSGETVVFDDSFVHSVRTGGQERVVLVIDVWHPSLLSEMNQDIRESIVGVFPTHHDEQAVEIDYNTSNLEDGRAVSAVAAVVMREAQWATVTAVAVTEGDVSETHVVVPHAAVTGDTGTGTTCAMSSFDGDIMSVITTIVPEAEVVETTSLKAAAVTGDNQAQTVLKIANEALDEQQRRLQLVQSHQYNSTAVVRAEDVFVSVPEARDGYSHHPRSVLYEKHYEKLKSEKQWFDLLFKTAMLGCYGVGKTSFLFRAANDTYPPRFFSTASNDFYVVNRGYSDELCPWSVNNGPVTVRLQMWDTAGPERFRKTSAYYRGVSGVFIVFDLTDRESFHDVCKWTSEVEKYAPSDVAVVLVGLKNDFTLPYVNGNNVTTINNINDNNTATINNDHIVCREVSFIEAKEFANVHQIPYLECSAKTGEHVEDVLATMIHHIVMKRVQHDLLKLPILARKKVADNIHGHINNTSNLRCHIS